MQVEPELALQQGVGSDVVKLFDKSQCRLSQNLRCNPSFPVEVSNLDTSSQCRLSQNMDCNPSAPIELITFISVAMQVEPEHGLQPHGFTRQSVRSGPARLSSTAEPQPGAVQYRFHGLKGCRLAGEFGAKPVEDIASAQTGGGVSLCAVLRRNKS